MKRNIFYTGLIAATTLLTFASCYDLDEMSRDPYGVEGSENAGGEITPDKPDEGKYADININYAVSHDDSVAYKKALADAPATFRTFLYQGYYNDYQITTNLSHDIYAGYVANNQPKHAKKSPDYGYSTGRSGRRQKEVVGLQNFAIKTPFRSYMAKEIKTLVRTPAYRKYCVVVNLIWPILVVALFNIPASADSIRAFRDTFGRGLFLADMVMLVAVIALAFFATAMNSIASTAFTREGSHISFIKHIPMTYDLQIRAKVWVSMLFSGVTIAVTTVILCIYMECSVIDSVYYVVLGILGSGICTYTGVLLDSTHPKLDWEDEYGALRGNLNAFFNMAIAIVIAIVLCVAGYLVFKFTMIPSYAVYIIFFIIMGAILVILRSITMRRSAWNIDTDVYSY